MQISQKRPTFTPTPPNDPDLINFLTKFGPKALQTEGVPEGGRAALFCLPMGRLYGIMAGKGL